MTGHLPPFELTVDNWLVDSIYKHKQVPLSDVAPRIKNSISENQVYLLKASNGQSVTVQYKQETFYLLDLSPKHRPDVYQDFNIRQKALYALLEDEETGAVFVFGKAGTGKTFAVLSYALDLMNKKKIDSIAIAKPIVPVSDSKFMGTLPGDAHEKTAPFLNSFYDVAKDLGYSFEFDRWFQNGLEEYGKGPYIEFIITDFARGRTLNHDIVIFDEIQNYNVHEMRTMLTRVSAHSKLIGLGDLRQCDHHEVSGIEQIVSHPDFKNSPLCASLELIKRYRHPFAALVEDILDQGNLDPVMTF